MPGYDLSRIASLEERLAVADARKAGSAMVDLELLVDLYLEADSYVPALETIERLLSMTAARALPAERRLVLECKAVSCRIAQGNCQAALAHCRELLPIADDVASVPARVQLHLLCAEALFRLGRLAECREQGQSALTLAEQGSDVSLMAAALNSLGRVAYREGDLDLARDEYEQALALFRRLGDEGRAASVRNNLGLVHKNLCQWDLAAVHLNAALEVHRRNGHFAETANPLMNLGIVHQKSGDWEKAAGCYLQARQVYAQVGDHLRLAVTAIGLGNVARLERRFVEAEGLLLEALERARGQGAQREEVLALEFLAELDFDRGRPDAALSRYDAALGFARRIAPEGDLVLEIERRRAEALFELGRHDEARVAATRSRELAAACQDRLEHAVAHRVEAAILHAQGHLDDALALSRRAVTLLGECHEKLETGRALLDLARITTDTEEARRSLYRASALFAELSTDYWIERSEQQLRQLLGGESAVPPMRAGSTIGRRSRAPRLVACSRATRRVETLAQRAAVTDLSVLITGETGTGKELVARTIHAGSNRSDRPFLAVNCGALRADLALSQLFGHRKGAFTGAHAEGAGLVEAAHGGTLFLDEVGDLPHDVQVTLLRFLESGEYLRLGETQVRRADVRLIAATHRELRGVDGERLFRRDLLYRLNEIEIRLPSLRERAEDIVPLARHFLVFYGGLEGPRLTHAAESVLRSYPWPGNVRELENVTKRVAALHAGGLVDAVHLIPFLGDASATHVPSTNGTDERSAILEGWERAHGNKSRLAILLGVSRKTLYARLRRLNLELQ